jgi:hypothetical protein
MMEQPEARTPPLQRHLERLDREMSIVDSADGPADDEPRKQIQDHGQVAFPVLPDAEFTRVSRTAAVSPSFSNTTKTVRSSS